MNRLLVLFAREPAREARAKGFLPGKGVALFREFAAGWLEAARNANTRVLLAGPAEDRMAWLGWLLGAPGPLWLSQRGDSLGSRLEDAARRAARLGTHVILVGGDVAPDSAALAAGFRALEAGVEAVLGPSPDGGLSLIGLPPGDLDLLNGVRERRRTLAAEIHAALLARGRRVLLLDCVADVDGRASLRQLLRSERLPVPLKSVGRVALENDDADLLPAPALPRFFALDGPPAPRGPPPAA